MNSIKDLTATSQVVLQVFDFSTNLRSVFIQYRNSLVEAVGSRIPFECLIVFPFLENVSDPERELSDLELDCNWSKTGAMRMEVLAGLLEMVPGVDGSTIKFTVCGKKRSKGEPIFWGGIGFIMVWACVRADCWPVTEDGRLKILKRGESRAMELPDGCTLNGGVTPECKADKKAETKKPGLHIVPKRGDRKKKRARKKVSRPDVVKYFSKVNPRSNWQVTFKAILKDSKYRDLAMDSRTGHKRTKWARIYSRGIDRLANTTGQCDKTVRSHIELMIEQKIIKEAWHGFKGQGYSRLEIPLNMSHVFAWRRKPPN